MLKSITQVNQNDKQISKTVKRFFIMQEISRSDISGITTKAPCEVALMGERHVRIEISDFVMRTFVHFWCGDISCKKSCADETHRVSRTTF